MQMRFRKSTLALVLLLVVTPALAQVGPRFEVSFPAAAHAEPITGRVFVIITRSDQPEPRLQLARWGLRSEAPFFGSDVSAFKPGETAVIDAATLGYPLKSLKDI